MRAAGKKIGDDQECSGRAELFERYERRRTAFVAHQARKIKKRKNPKFPPINADFYGTAAMLNPEEIKILTTVREFMQKEVAPLTTEYWMKGEFPFQIVEGLKKLGICGLTLPKEYGGAGRSLFLEGMIGAEIARTEASAFANHRDANDDVSAQPTSRPGYDHRRKSVAR